MRFFPEYRSDRLPAKTEAVIEMLSTADIASIFIPFFLMVDIPLPFFTKDKFTITRMTPQKQGFSRQNGRKYYPWRLTKSM
ncbi:hypothetical protein ANACAC_00136 [Anaerostipes caccae L1-92]|uniref:Uncharacterized protein n=1 Tax=Anaerostipes caccae (strain DSM 14662 / CCUG 47493 / JCM 13470 / NCIMB 13811 / L1-92) TaxID=411490 RepID=B0M9G7_ANACD|nr:hypothetical protein ANACAC_00136 [Anaerostipes caccae L1-92]